MKTSAKYLLSMIVFALAFSIMIFANIHGISDVEVKRLEPIEILKSNPAAKEVNAEKAEVKQIDKASDESTVYMHDEADVEMHGACTRDGRYENDLWKEYAENDFFSPGITDRHTALVERD